MILHGVDVRVVSLKGLNTLATLATPEIPDQSLSITALSARDRQSFRTSEGASKEGAGDASLSPDDRLLIRDLSFLGSFVLFAFPWSLLSRYSQSKTSDV